MLGLAGAVCCLAAGTATGSWMKMRRMARWKIICAQLEALQAMRLMLETEKPALPDLLEASAVCAGGGEETFPRRLRLTAQQLRREPADGIGAAYAVACAQTLTGWEQAEEKDALENLFSQLGSGTAAMREQAVAACIRRLKPVCDAAKAEAERAGRLSMQLGLLLGLMAGIALW